MAWGAGIALAPGKNVVSSADSVRRRGDGAHEGRAVFRQGRGGGMRGWAVKGSGQGDHWRGAPRAVRTFALFDRETVKRLRRPAAAHAGSSPCSPRTNRRRKNPGTPPGVRARATVSTPGRGFTPRRPHSPLRKTTNLARGSQHPRGRHPRCAQKNQTGAPGGHRPTPPINCPPRIKC